jgi:hypothetical protein
MSTIAELRAKVRSQTEQTSSELGNDTIDSFLREAFNRTISAETSWPFYEESWVLTQAVGDTTIDLPTTVGKSLQDDPAYDGIVSLKDTSNDNFRLTMIDHDIAEDEYFGASNTSGVAVEFSVWKDVIYLWPQVTFTTERSYAMRGYRKPIDWLDGPSTNEPDCDDRLHLPLANYAIALSYAKQEDETLERTYMERWQRDVEMARQAIMDPGHHQPLMMGPRRWRRIGRGRYRFNYTIQTP